MGAAISYQCQPPALAAGHFHSTLRSVSTHTSKEQYTLLQGSLSTGSCSTLALDIATMLPQALLLSSTLVLLHSRWTQMGSLLDSSLFSPWPSILSGPFCTLLWALSLLPAWILLLFSADPLVLSPGTPWSLSMNFLTLLLILLHLPLGSPLSHGPCCTPPWAPYSHLDPAAPPTRHCGALHQHLHSPSGPTALSPGTIPLSPCLAALSPGLAVLSIGTRCSQRVLFPKLSRMQ